MRTYKAYGFGEYVITEVGDYDWTVTTFSNTWHFNTEVSALMFIHGFDAALGVNSPVKIDISIAIL